MGVVKSRISGSRGQSLAEFALVVPIFILLMFMVIDFSRMVESYVAIQHGAREGARYAVTGRSDCNLASPTRMSCIDQVAKQQTGPLNGGGVNVSVESWKFQSGGYAATPTANSAGIQCDDVQVKVTYQYQPLFPLVKSIFGSIPLTATERLVNEPFGACGTG